MSVLTGNENISQKAIKELENYRTQLDTLKEDKRYIETEIEVLNDAASILEGQLVYALDNKLRVSPGKYKIHIMIKKVLPRISWKQVVIKFKSDEFAQELMDSRKPEYKKKITIEV